MVGMPPALVKFEVASVEDRPEEVLVKFRDGTHLTTIRIQKSSGRNFDALLRQAGRVYFKRLGLSPGHFGFYVDYPDEAALAERARRKYAPPRAAELIIAFIAPPALAETTLGCLEEQFQGMRNRFGHSTAVVWYWWGSARTAVAFLWTSLSRLFDVTTYLK